MIETERDPSRNISSVSGSYYWKGLRLTLAMCKNFLQAKNETLTELLECAKIIDISRLRLD